ncbi:hypothetical protein QCA50_018959 [Cerrena zonata]|uniref:Phosphatidylserine decarboxylase n=1 Tax=Cerrena zonata TaxID=2478898 RepID=A0AAW0FGI7_9APHY
MSESDIVQILRDYLDDNPEFRKDFESAFRLALTYNIKQFDDFAIRTLDDYLNHYESYVKWIPIENNDGNKVYYHLCLFHFVLDLPPLKQHQSPVDPKSHWTWLSQWIVDFSKAIGRFHDTPESITPESLQTFRDCPKYSLDDYQEPEGGWKTFNDFFGRKIKPGLRDPDPDTDVDVVIVHPADSVYNGPWSVDDTNHVEFVKHVPWNISQLLDGTRFGGKFKGGKFIHSFLNSYDYHRQHAPVGGKVVDARVIPGLCYVEVVPVESRTNPERTTTTLRMKRKLAHNEAHKFVEGAQYEGLEAPDTPGFQFIQTRGLILIDNPDIGLVGVLPIGMAQVSSIVVTVEVGQDVKKGDEISYFQFGGSDCIMVFQGGVDIEFTAKPGGKYLCGKQIAVARKGQRKVRVG